MQILSKNRLKLIYRTYLNEIEGVSIFWHTLYAFTPTFYFLSVCQNNNDRLILCISSISVVYTHKADFGVVNVETVLHL